MKSFFVRFSIFVFFSLSGVSLLAAQPDSGAGKQEAPPPLVEKEYLVIRPSDDVRKVIAPYKERRKRWGFLVSFAYSLYSPLNYQPNFQPDFDFDGLYDSNGMLELNITRKFNFSGGSLGLGVGAGYSKASSLSGAPAESTLTVIPLRAEVSLILDAIMPEPWVAPYGFAGVYTAFFNEEQLSSSTESASTFSGSTAAATYIGAGINFQLDWLEPRTALRSYLDYGIENTYVYVELKKYMTSIAEDDPDFETGMVVAAGARFEY